MSARLARIVLGHAEATAPLLRALAYCLDPAMTEMGEPIVWERTQDGWSGTTTITRFGPEWRTREGVATPEVEVTLTAVIEHADHTDDARYHEQYDILELQVERIAYDFGAHVVEVGGLPVVPDEAEEDWADSARERHRSAMEAAE